MMLNDLFNYKQLDSQHSQVNPEQVIVLRHRPFEAGLAKVLPWLAEEHHDVFNAYQWILCPVLEKSMLKMIKNGDAPFIVDLRHPLDILPDPRTLPGALKLSPEEVESGKHEIPDDRDIILFCTCPNEATSARVALQLKKHGITRVRPLEGGFYKWRELGYPMEDALVSNAE